MITSNQTRALWNKYQNDRQKRLAIQFNLMTLNAECEAMVTEIKEKVARIPG